MRGNAIAVTAALVVGGTSLPAQQPAPEPPGPKVGEVAPDFALPGATRYGVLRDSVRLSQFQGQTVVLAFFAQARTRG